ncbi:MAG: hypothetical protein KGL39_47380, partial [Patescibacteria group bacterium]|nr:hypothetical protein [Patescibacteria group bacterium]
MATSTAPIPVEQFEQQGAGAIPQQSDDHTTDDPSPKTQQQVEAELDQKCREALLWIRKTFKMRYQPKRMRFITGVMRAFEALRGNTYALLNDQSAALDTINQLMQGYLGQGDDPQLYAHNDNIYQAFAMIFIAALMVDLGKVRYQPADAQEEPDLKIANKASTIHAYNERKNDSTSLQQLELLYLWLGGCYFTYVRYVVDSDRAGMGKRDNIQMRPVKIAPDGYICPQCGEFTEESKTSLFSSEPQCPNCGANLAQSNWREGPTLDLPVKVGEIEAANGMTAFDVVNGLAVAVNPDAMKLKDTELLDYSIETSVGPVRAAYPAMYTQITPTLGADAAVDGDMARMARAGETTPGANNRAITTEGLGTHSRCWIQRETFSELE